MFARFRDWIQKLRSTKPTVQERPKSKRKWRTGVFNVWGHKLSRHDVRMMQIIGCKNPMLHLVVRR